jgi:hypothetical protein
VKGWREGADLCEQPFGERQSRDRWQGRDVVDQLGRIQSGALAACHRQDIDDVRMDPLQPELEGLIKTHRARADDQRLGQRFCQRGTHAVSGQTQRCS